MQAVRDRGQVHEISLGLNEPEYINKFLNTEDHKLNSILSAGNWNLLDQSGAENFARWRKLKMSPKVQNVYQNQWFSLTFRSKIKFHSLEIQFSTNFVLGCAKEGVEIHNAAVFAGGFLFGGKAWKYVLHILFFFMFF